VLVLTRVSQGCIVLCDAEDEPRGEDAEDDAENEDEGET
jgi:hypothetical protein